jgi:hypothetical protein
MFKRLKQALVSSYVGTLAIGWIFAQGLLHFAYVFSAPIASWIARSEYRGIVEQSTVKGFVIRDAVPDLARSIALLALGYLLLRWLYFGQIEEPEVDNTSKTSESANRSQLA